jgi:hypothetical protein
MRLHARPLPSTSAVRRLRCTAASSTKFYTHSLCPYAQRVSLTLLEKGEARSGLDWHSGLDWVGLSSDRR